MKANIALSKIADRCPTGTRGGASMGVDMGVLRSGSTMLRGAAASIPNRDDRGARLSLHVLRFSTHVGERCWALQSEDVLVTFNNRVVVLSEGVDVDRLELLYSAVPFLEARELVHNVRMHRRACRRVVHGLLPVETEC